MQHNYHRSECAVEIASQLLLHLFPYSDKVNEKKKL